MPVKFFLMRELFPILERGKVHSQENLPEGKGYFYVGAKKRDNGVMSECGHDDSLLSPGNCLVFICNGEGSVGYSLYMDRPFYASGDLVLGYNDHLNKYIGLYLVALLDRERPKYSFGRKYGTHIEVTKIPLPSTEEGDPDWTAIENLVKDRYLPLLPAISKTVWSESYDRTPIRRRSVTLRPETWEHFYVKDLFDSFETTKGSTTDELVPGKDVPYIAAKHANNGLDSMCSRRGNEEFISRGNCIVFIQLGQGSAGYALYQGGDFIGMSGKTLCAYSSHLNKYNGLFLATVLSKERPKYSFGRSWTGDRLMFTRICLPAKRGEDGTFYPDWAYMEKYMKSLPYSKEI